MKKLLLFFFFSCLLFDAVASPTLTQSSWRWRNDDGSETSATWKGSENQEIKVNSADETLRLRIKLNSQADANHPQDNWPVSISNAISYATSPAGPFTRIPVTSTAGEHFVLAAGAHVPSGTATTRQLATSAGESFRAGEVINSSTAAGMLTFNNETIVKEFEWVIKPTSAAVGGKYYFRLDQVNYSGPLPSIDYAPITISTTQTNVSCNGGSNGSATVTASGGTAPYTYSWSPAGGTEAEATGLAAGTYTVTVTDIQNRTATAEVTITEPSALSAVASKTDATKPGAADGTASVTASGGAGGYTYDWVPGAPQGDGTPSITGLTAGTYTVTITDDNGCTKTESVTVGQPQDTQAPVPTVAELPVARGECAVTLTAPTATDDYAGTVTGTTNGPLTYTVQGTYTVTWTYDDGNGNTATQTQQVEVKDVTNPVFTAEAPISRNSDTGACGAVVTFTVPEATDNCIATVTQTAGLASGSFFPVGTTVNTFTATDAAGNTASISFNVTVTDNELPTVNARNFTVRLNADGEATITPEDIDNGSSDACGIRSLALSKTTFTCADAGDKIVTLTVTDNNGNMATATATVTVEKATQEITFAELADATYGNAAITLSGTATSGVPVTYIVEGPATLNGNVLTITGAGQVTVTAAQAGNDCFETAANIVRTFTVAKKALVVVADNKSRIYGEENPALTFTITGFTGSETVQELDAAPVATTTAIAESNAGEYTILVAGGSDDNYSFTYQSGILTVTKASATIELSNLEQPEDGQPKIVTATTTPEGLGVVITYDGSTTAPAARGNYAVVATISDINYTGTASATLTVQAPTGIADKADELNSIVLYPNPTKDGMVYLELDNVKAGNSMLVEIFTASGRLLSSQKVSTTGKQELDMTKHTSGLYMVRITDGNSIRTVKVHKQ
ncbi:MBG domain-containing protein [Pontibacter sp. H249]|uniref:MBG domain-containing protein n=1 Tax=Pontibacter sp. H249 TaxID=3133420 RepID=UPI0030BD9B1B